MKYIFEQKVYNEKPQKITDFMDYEEFFGEDGEIYRNYMEKDGIRLVKKVLSTIWTDLATKTEKFLKIISIIIVVFIIWIFIYLYNITNQIKENNNIKSNIIMSKIKENTKFLSWQNQKINNINNILENIDVNTLTHFMYIYKTKINNLYNKKIENGWNK